MAAHEFDCGFLERRRRQLGMSRTALAQRSSVSLATVHRILNGGLENATVASIRAVAEALGVDLQMQEATNAHGFRERQARTKAERLVGLVQGSSRLEEQAVDSETLTQMVQQTIHELMAGSGRRLWAP